MLLISFDRVQSAKILPESSLLTLVSAPAQ
jgi:hypothetical protein